MSGDTHPLVPRMRDSREPGDIYARELHGGSGDVLRLAREAQTYLEGWKRARADYENLSRRSAELHSAARREGMQQALLAFLNILDHFDVALVSIPPEIASHPWVDGMRHIRSAFAAALEAEGIQSIGDVRVPFDPTRHEAVESIPAHEPVGTVLDVVSRGYVHEGRVLRPAKVRVSVGNA